MLHFVNTSSSKISQTLQSTTQKSHQRTKISLSKKTQFFPLKKIFFRSTYEARTEKELAVLKRYFSAEDIKLEKSKFLDIILYSKDQIQKENEAMGNTDPNKDIDYDWGIVSIKAQDSDSEIPMEPITAMRNALGKDQGGSGVPLDRDEYQRSVDFWNLHAIVK